MPLELTGLIASEMRVTLLGIGSFPLDKPMLASSHVPKSHYQYEYGNMQGKVFQGRVGKSKHNLTITADHYPFHFVCRGFNLLLLSCSGKRKNM